MANYKREGSPQDESTISISDLLQGIWKRILWVVAAVFICAALAGIYTQFFVTPLYSASCWLFVNSYSSNTTVTQVNSAQLDASTQLVTTYIKMLASDSVMADISDELGGYYSAEELSGKISASAADDTQILVVTATDPDPNMAAKIANAVAVVAPENIQDYVEGSSVTVPQYATVPLSPSSPSLSRNLMMAALIGLVIGVGAALIAHFADTRIVQPNTLEEEFDFPVLGVIPNLDSDDASAGYYSSYSYHSRQE